MAERSLPLSSSGIADHSDGQSAGIRLGLLLGFLALGLMTSVTLLAFYGLLSFADSGFDWQLLTDPYLHRIFTFTLWQAFLSALLSVALAWPVALALSWLPKPRSRGLFLGLCILCFVMPTLVLITGLVALLGQSGMLTAWLPESWNLYGLQGILIAHIYLNFPFAVRSIYLRLEAIPASSWRMARQLKLSRWQQFRYLEWGAARSASWIAFGFILVLCFNSFAVVLALGGGPRSTTFEVAIYQALKYDFNIPEALLLAWAQLLIAGSLFLLINALGRVNWLGQETPDQRHRPTPARSSIRICRLIYILAWGFLLSPLLALWPKAQPMLLNGSFWTDLLGPLGTTLALALVTTFAAVSIAYAALLPYRQAVHRGSLMALIIDGLASHTLVVPAMVLSVGIFIFILPRLDPEPWAFALVVLVNTLIAVPFAITQLKPALLSYDQQYQKLRLSLKLSLSQRAQIEWRFARPAVMTAAAFVCVLAMGDVAIYSIFGHQDFVTLPWLIYGYASTYRVNEAAAASLVLLFLSLVTVMILEKSRLITNRHRPVPGHRHPHPHPQTNQIKARPHAGTE